MHPQNNYKEWYRFAKMYANAASFLMDKRGPPYEAVCYLSDLSAECTMKGFLLECNQVSPSQTLTIFGSCAKPAPGLRMSFHPCWTIAKPWAGSPRHRAFPPWKKPPRRTQTNPWTPFKVCLPFSIPRSNPRGLS